MADQTRLDVHLGNGVTVRKADTYDVAWIATRLRPEDAAELQAATPGEALDDLLYTGLMSSDPCYVLEHFEDPVLIFGVAPHHEYPQIGVVWAVGTTGIHKVRREIVKYTKEWLKKIQGDYEYLTNYVDTRNKTHIRWLQWAGAEFHQTLVHPTSGVPFMEFTINV